MAAVTACLLVKYRDEDVQGMQMYASINMRKKQWMLSVGVSKQCTKLELTRSSFQSEMLNFFSSEA